ncbi:hypothetical protein PGT21_016422 [Puccinia graminis f. sp. tritici]|uniref:Uncharacterized protein n=2 Tax=Puccinia graminis f. sp. tritici TaxID=56615 RepID=H6QUD2_PUCGT|nr:uncharacterized protein PGTG_22383 [Puccinia graminis f. sp. tritici CRL 75-36-700-3]EHS64595.1 hypothetical protein PGTG_22383 [Puccinia graminis f. sp. tritici CRL 75-36-700-3]KAA1079618.1 hypothetical protein PGT21_017580 [Puccinia graminis f. sp. tritici]KAA1082838.1 hypothetical protein PGT21_016257 [Puccinia graminis f. sp. tritici]KAA1082845.1 hypothetical protein PGT21_016422 [Puccinia graminis f. sp. tritici]
MNFSMTCIVLLSILSIISCAAVPAGAAGGEGAPKGGADGGDKKAKAASILQAVSKGLAAGGLGLSSGVTGAVGSGLKGGA